LERLRNQEGGFTLTELLVTILLLGLVMGAVIAMLTTAYKIVPGDIEWTHRIAATQNAMGKMTRDLRQATAITIKDSAGTAVIAPANSGPQIAADVVLGGSIRHILYECTTQCTRWMTTAPTAAPTTSSVAGNGVVKSVVITDLQNNAQSVNAFAQPTATAKYFTIDLRVKSTGSVKGTQKTHTVTFTDGFFGRNA
jgi:prepilin-type N-terminal cleavage/methylation domain-containing protein